MTWLFLLTLAWGAIAEAARLRWEPGVYRVNEGQGTAQFALRIDASGECPPGSTVAVEESSVRLRTFPSTGGSPAAPGSDFVSQDLSWPLGSTRVVWQVAGMILEDAEPEGDEVFGIEIVSFAPADLAVSCAGLSFPVTLAPADAFAEVTITDNDPFPTIAVSNVTVTEGESSVALFDVVLDREPTAPFSVSAFTVDGSARAGEDYSSLSQSLSFGPGALARTVAVSILDDGLEEPFETFSLRLGPVPSTVRVGRGEGIGGIADDDGSGGGSGGGGGGGGSATETLEILRVSALAGRPGAEIEAVVAAGRSDGTVPEGAAVAWAVAAGSATLRSPVTLTDAAGLSGNQIRLGSTLGRVQIQASLSSGAAVTFELEVTERPGPIDGSPPGCDDPSRLFADELEVCNDQDPGDKNIPVDTVDEAARHHQETAVQILRTIRNEILQGSRGGLKGFGASAARSTHRGPSQGQAFSLNLRSLVVGGYRSLGSLYVGGAVGYIEGEAQGSQGDRVDYQDAALTGFVLWMQRIYPRQPAWVIPELRTPEVTIYADLVAVTGESRLKLARPFELQGNPLVARARPRASFLGITLEGGAELRRDIVRKRSGKTGSGARGKASSASLGFGAFGRLSSLETRVDAYLEDRGPASDLAIDSQRLEGLLAQGGARVSYWRATQKHGLFLGLEASYGQELADRDRLIIARIANRPGGRLSGKSRGSDGSFFALELMAQMRFVEGWSINLAVGKELDRAGHEIEQGSLGIVFELPF